MAALILLLTPFLWPLVALAGGLAVFGANWYLGLTDWKTALIFIGVVIGVAAVSQSTSVWSRLAVTAIIALGCYFKGQVDGGARLESKFEALRTEEAERQEKANMQARLDAEVARKKAEEELAVIQAQIEKAKKEAKDDPTANRPALSIRSIERLNRLRARPTGSIDAGRSSKAG